MGEGMKADRRLEKGEVRGGRQQLRTALAEE